MLRTLYEKYHAIISEYYGDFGNAYSWEELMWQRLFFLIPGIGTLAYESARYKDYNLLMIISLMSGIIIIACNMAAQILNEQDRSENAYQQAVGNAGGG